MGVYFVQIGTKNRKGKFREHSHSVVNVSDIFNYSDVFNYFKNRYEGLEVIIEQPKEMDISDKIVKTGEVINSKESHIFLDEDTVVALPENITMISELSWFEIEYTEDEKKLHNDYNEYLRKSRRSLQSLHKSISDRYEKLPYSSIGIATRFGSKEMELETNSVKTMCKKFPIRGKIFIEAAEKCTAITAPATDNPSFEVGKSLNEADTDENYTVKDSEFGDIPF
ncbi:MAG: hypothetical protein FWB73_00045 [Treponema sp.]|nr:hypothetical protein [Treponema sp.]